MKYFLLFTLLFLSSSADINLIKKENSDSNTTLLVIGGIHGDEPGGYFAASILATHYTINSKNLWIVPNLNKNSIIRNRRGINGDMNRKFSSLRKNDKDKDIVQEIKKTILEPNVSLVLNLHDGHGFYRKKHQGTVFNPNAWGQTCVIDQGKLQKSQEFGNLNEIACIVKDNLNKKLLENHHTFDVKNTKTKFDDEDMQLSLTYYAVTNNKPAFAIESSKNLSSLSQKVFYQLLAIEEFMKIMDINFTRSFKLSEKGISKVIKEYGVLILNNNTSFDLSNVKKRLSYIPIKLKNNIFRFTHPLGKIRKINGTYNAYIGHKKVISLKPQYFNMAKNCPDKFEVLIDGKSILVNKASYFQVNDDFTISKTDDIRVNVIGFQAKGKVDESQIKISLRDVNKKFSIDKNKKIYRIEFYKNDKFCSMSMVQFK